MTKFNSKTILFITGAFVSSECWNDWVKFYESKGYTCIVPSWPQKDAPAAALRKRHPDERMASQGLADLVEYFADNIKTLPEKPILIGHSIGGLIVQLLLQRDIAAAGVAIHPVAPQGVFVLSLSMLKAVWGPLGYFTSVKKSFLMSFKQWQFAFTNGMRLHEQESAYNRFATPDSKLISRDGLTKIAHVNFVDLNVPLLITSGTTDTIVPAKLNRANYEKYRNSFAKVDYMEFEGRNHFVLGQPTWQEDARYILNWIEKL